MCITKLHVQLCLLSQHAFLLCKNKWFYIWKGKKVKKNRRNKLSSLYKTTKWQARSDKNSHSLHKRLAVIVDIFLLRRNTQTLYDYKMILIVTSNVSLLTPLKSANRLRKSCIPSHIPARLRYSCVVISCSL